MEKSLAVLGNAVFVAATVFIVVILSTAIGGFVGWCTGLVFPHTLGHIAALLGLNEPYQVGAAAGFVGSFFRPNSKSRD